jgi:hypothetical protein
LLLFDVFEVLAILVHNYFGGIVEVDPCGPIRQQVAQTVLCGIVDPLFDVNLGVDYAFF